MGNLKQMAVGQMNKSEEIFTFLLVYKEEHIKDLQTYVNNYALLELLYLKKRFEDF